MTVHVPLALLNMHVHVMSHDMCMPCVKMRVHEVACDI